VSKDARQTFINQVYAMFPPVGNVQYTWNESSLPTVGANDLLGTTPPVLHLCLFGWGGSHSVKGCPELVTSLKLLTEILNV
jgi:hypothetical protein